MTGDGSKVTQYDCKAVIIKVCPLVFMLEENRLHKNIFYDNNETLRIDFVRKTNAFLNLKNFTQFFSLGLKIDQHFDENC